ncbi:MAG: hypothetical protein AAF587_31690 [Bacteroidota bacterium]
MKPRHWQTHPMPVAIHQPARYRGADMRAGWKRVGKGIQRGIEGMIQLLQKGWAGLRMDR